MNLMTKRTKEKRNKPEEEILEEEQEEKLQLEPEIKNSILAVLFSALALILILSFFNLAGSLGRFIFKMFDYLLGWGYFLLPVLLLTISFNFFRSWTERINFNKTTFSGAFLVLFSSLSILELFSPATGGLIGETGAFLKNFLGLWASLIIYIAILISGLLLTFNTPLKIPQFLFKRKEGLIINPPEAPLVIEEKAEKEERKAKEEMEAAKEEEKRKNHFPAKVKGNYVVPSLDLL